MNFVAAVAALVPESRSEGRPAIDWWGVVGSSAGLTLFMYGVIEAGRVGWGDPGTVGPLLAGVLVIAAFAAWELRLAAAGEMASALAHEINQPLSAIASYLRACQLMLDRPEAERSRLAGTLAAQMLGVAVGWRSRT